MPVRRCGLPLVSGRVEAGSPPSPAEDYIDRNLDLNEYLIRHPAGTYFATVPLAVEFRHASRGHPSTLEGLKDRNITLAVPDVAPIESRYRSLPAVTTDTGYVRGHCRNADNCHKGSAAANALAMRDLLLGEE